MDIHQINVSYAAKQDRLLVRINSQSGEELRVWLTRRVSLQLFPLLQRSSQEQLQAHLGKPDPAAAPSEQRQQLVRNFQKEAEIYQGDYQTPFREQPTALPLGEDPLLVTKLKFTPLAQGKLALTLLEKLQGRQRDIEVVMDAKLTQGLIHLLRQAIEASEWLQVAELGAHPAPKQEQTDPDGDAEDGNQTAKPRYLN
jgi:hypothetical protein